MVGEDASLRAGPAGSVPTGLAILDGQTLARGDWVERMSLCTGRTMKRSSQLALVVGAFLADQPPVSALEWVNGKQSSCFAACSSVGKKAFWSGTHPNGKHYAVCSANTGNEGNRSGWNLEPNWSNRCFTSRGGKEVANSGYLCLCY